MPSPGQVEEVNSLISCCSKCFPKDQKVPSLDKGSYSCLIEAVSVELGSPTGPYPSNYYFSPAVPGKCYHDRQGLIFLKLFPETKEHISVLWKGGWIFTKQTESFLLTYPCLQHLFFTSVQNKIIYKVSTSEGLEVK